VPVSSSQAVIGAVIGVGIIKGIRGLKYHTLGGIAIGWVTTPLVACVITFIFSLFFLQNVFNQQVSQNMSYLMDNVRLIVETLYATSLHKFPI
jgi:PiT family inorganic phosphate transporter